MRHLLEGQANADIVRMIISLAHALEMNVTAEGVETTLQSEALLGYGCTLAQGYLYSRPVPAESILLHVRDAALV
ncbi:MAG: hypothetical protein NVSMB21_26170 [Vulcanimicrobiaceae bacterium]